MWCVKLSDSQRDALRALVRDQDEAGPGAGGRARGARARALGRPARGHAAVGPRRRARRAAGHRRGRRGLGPRRRDAAEPAKKRVGAQGAAAEARAPAEAALVLVEARRRPCGRACPRRSARARASGTSAPIDSPIAAATSRPTKSSSAERPHRVAGAQLHAGVDRLWLEAVALEQPHGVEQVGEQQLVDDEAGGVGHLDRGLAELARRARCSSSSCRRPSPRRGTTAPPASSSPPG